MTKFKIQPAIPNLPPRTSNASPDIDTIPLETPGPVQRELHNLTTKLHHLAIKVATYSGRTTPPETAMHMWWQAIDDFPDLGAHCSFIETELQEFNGLRRCLETEFDKLNDRRAATQMEFRETNAKFGYMIKKCERLYGESESGEAESKELDMLIAILREGTREAVQKWPLIFAKYRDEFRILKLEYTELEVWTKEGEDALAMLLID